MLTVIERRRLVLARKGRPLSDPAARIITTAKTMMETRLKEMASLFRATDESHGENSPPLSPLPVIPLIKPVGDHCNLRCRYCFNKPSSPFRLMPDQLLETLIAQVFDLNPGVTDFIFHGGEPLLAGMQFFEKAMSFQERHNRRSQKIRNFITTNGTLLNDEWAQFFSKHKFGVTVSIDGPPEVHDRNRVDASGRGTAERVMKGIQTLKAHQLRPGILSVIPAEPQVSARELFDFVASLGVRDWRANPIRSIEPVNRYAEFMEDLFDVWSTSKEDLHVTMIRETLHGQLGYAPPACFMKGSCHKFIGFEPDGVVSPCCEMSLDPPFHFGNLSDTSLRNILESTKARKFWSDQRKGTECHCHGCAWSHLCRGGCTYQRLQYSGSPEGKDYMCETYRDVFSRLTARIDSILLNAGSEADRSVEKREAQMM